MLNIPLSNFFPSLLISLIAKMSSKTMLDVSEAMDDAPKECSTLIVHYVNRTKGSRDCNRPYVG